MKKIFFAMAIVSGITSYSPAWADTACFVVQGMTCATCPITVKTAIKKLKGISAVKVSLEEKNALVDFDSSKTTVAEVKKAIEDAGYKAAPHECTKTK